MFFGVYRSHKTCLLQPLDLLILPHVCEIFELMMPLFCVRLHSSLHSRVNWTPVISQVTTRGVTQSRYMSAVNQKILVTMEA